MKGKIVYIDPDIVIARWLVGYGEAPSGDNMDGDDLETAVRAVARHMRVHRIEDPRHHAALTNAARLVVDYILGEAAGRRVRRLGEMAVPPIDDVAGSA